MRAAIKSKVRNCERKVRGDMLNAKNNGKKVLVTMIGASDAIGTEYAFFESSSNKKETVYRRQYDNAGIAEKMQYGYPFWAKIRSITKEKAFDQIVFIGTRASKWESLISNAESLSGEVRKNKPELNEKRAYPEVTEHLREYEIELSRYITLAVNKMCNAEVSPIEVKVILVKEGRTEDENRENIVEIQKELSSLPISEITLDVTNGFRSQPMYVLSIINNISAVENKGIPVNIYYGMYDGKLKAQGEPKENNYVVPLNPREGEVAPMVDLKDIQIMDQWTRAISEFFSNGSVIQIIELLDDIREKTKENNCEKINTYINAFESFSLAVNSNNLLIFEEAMKKMELIKKDIEQNAGGEKETGIPIYVHICLNRIVLNICSQFRAEDEDECIKYSFYMFKLANWYLLQNRLGDSVRTFQEAVITYVMEKYPEKISLLLEKRMIQWFVKKNRISDVMFDAKVRKEVREVIFEENFKIEGREEEYREWEEWTKEYRYMKTHIHNPDALLYNLDQVRETITGEVSESGGNDTRTAKQNIQNFAEKISVCLGRAGDDNMFEKRIDYLLDIRYYDVFISYRRSYHSDDGEPLNDGVLLVTALSDYFSHKGLKVFVDKNRMKGVPGDFSPYLQQNLRNSKLCLVVLGKDAYARDFAETDEYYKEIITAVKNDMKIAVICMSDFYRGGNDIRFGQNVADQEKLMKVVNSLQRVGSEFSDRWKYENILSLRKCAYEEIIKMLEEE